MRIKGIAAAEGIGIGQAVRIEDVVLDVAARPIADDDVEVARFQRALHALMEETQALADELAAKLGPKEAEIMEAHVMLMSDPMITDEIEATVRRDNICCEYVIDNVYKTYADMFASMGDELMRQRASDMMDIKVRLLQSLAGVRPVDIGGLAQGSVIIANDLTPSMTAGIRPENVAGIVTQVGGRTSHSAILARALEIPAVAGAAGALDAIKDGDTVIVDGSAGDVFRDPDKGIISAYKAKRTVFLADKKELGLYVGKPTVTLDGVRVELVANIGKPADLPKVLEYDGEGVGLFRTEFLFMDGGAGDGAAAGTGAGTQPAAASGRTAMPTEEEQFDAYRQVAAGLGGKPVIIRTLDIGGDKDIPYMGLEREDNPFLGFRAIRYCLARKEDVFRPQLRALLRASAFGNIKIMIPMVTCIEEYRAARALIEDIKKELDAEGIAYKKDIQVGIMVETAAASLLADVFAKEVDFFSIGTNDLTQYTMSVDRGNSKVGYLYSPLQPALLRSIRHIIRTAKDAGIMVGMCGEAAADALLIPLLLAWGLDEFSVGASSILRTRKRICGYDAGKLQEVADKALSLDTAAEVEAYMRTVVEG
ncbi:MAG: phosphoenolpyruvate--protein phosphotransferase [Lachnospiraceae bacterium]|jgi:phosphotransferase system enzyme I (PtsI)|nr:phosphoenolpyruvate--protein phosphotransferase [Lachnospiraceae bacterium]